VSNHRRVLYGSGRWSVVSGQRSGMLTLTTDHWPLLRPLPTFPSLSTRSPLAPQLLHKERALLRLRRPRRSRKVDNIAGRCSETCRCGFSVASGSSRVNRWWELQFMSSGLVPGRCGLLKSPSPKGRDGDAENVACSVSCGSWQIGTFALKCGSGGWPGPHLSSPRGRSSSVVRGPRLTGALARSRTVTQKLKAARRPPLSNFSLRVV
jgi:hypothetical protein